MNKKKIIIAILLVMISITTISIGTIFASGNQKNGHFGIGAEFAYHNMRDTVNPAASLAFMGAGAHLNSYSVFGNVIALFWDLGIDYDFSYEIFGVNYANNFKMIIDLHSILGIGFRIPVSESINLFIGGGASGSASFFYPQTSILDSVLFLGYGFGIDTQMRIRFSQRFGINIGATTNINLGYAQLDVNNGSPIFQKSMDYKGYTIRPYILFSL